MMSDLGVAWWPWGGPAALDVAWWLQWYGAQFTIGVVDLILRLWRVL